jgi:cell division protease FtsH
LDENRDKLNKLADILLQKEVIFREDLEHIFGPRPFEDHEHIVVNGNGNEAEDIKIGTLPEATEPGIDPDNKDTSPNDIA